MIIGHTQDNKHAKICSVPVPAGLGTETVCHLSGTSPDTELQKLAPWGLGNCSPAAPWPALA